MLIGGAALLLMLANGRVMGVSSILCGLLGKAKQKTGVWHFSDNRQGFWFFCRQTPDTYR